MKSLAIIVLLMSVSQAFATTPDYLSLSCSFGSGDNYLQNFACERDNDSVYIEGNLTDLDVGLLQCSDYGCGPQDTSSCDPLAVQTKCETSIIQGTINNPLQLACGIVSPSNVAGCIAEAKGPVIAQAVGGGPMTDLTLAATVVCAGVHDSSLKSTRSQDQIKACENAMLTTATPPNPSGPDTVSFHSAPTPAPSNSAQAPGGTSP